MSYNFLKNETAPKILVEAYKLIGIKETLGKDNNPKILEWADKLGLKSIYTADEIPWCGLFMAWVCHEAGKPVVKGPLAAKNWLNYGTQEWVAMLGDVLVFSRKGGNHVGQYVAEDDKSYHVIGGNQADQVSIVRIDKGRCIGIRRTAWTTAQPNNVRRIFIDASGAISQNEI